MLNSNAPDRKEFELPPRQHWRKDAATMKTSMSLAPASLPPITGALVAGIAFGFLRAAVAQTQPSPQQTAATLDRMIAEHKSQQELAQYVFDTHGCKSCHTVGQNGKLGFTSRGQQVGQGFEGCIRLLTAMNVIAQLPDNRRSADPQGSTL